MARRDSDRRSGAPSFMQRIAGTVHFGDDSDDERKKAEVSHWLEETLKRELKVSKIVRDEDGDIPVACGSSMVYIREPKPDVPFLVVLAPLLEDFRMSADVFEAVNSINRQIPMAKVVVDDDDDTNQIVMSLELAAIDTLSADDLMLAIEIVGDAADHFDTLLQKRFGGTTALDDDDDEIDV